MEDMKVADTTDLLTILAQESKKICLSRKKIYEAFVDSKTKTPYVVISKMSSIDKELLSVITNIQKVHDLAM